MTRPSRRGRGLAGPGPRPGHPRRAPRRSSTRGDDGRALAARFGGRLEFGTAGPARRAGRRPEPDEPGHGHAGRRRARRLPAAPAAAASSSASTRGTARDGSPTTPRRCSAGPACASACCAEPVPTPVLAVRLRPPRRASPGVMVTASHNPPAGQRLQGLLGGRRADRPAGGPRDLRGDRRRRPRGRAAARRDAGTVAPGRPCRTSTRCRRCRLGDAAGPLVVYTPMHGVGARRPARGVRAGRLPRPARRRRSRPTPDPDFPTVAFPNPEEPGALDLALALAARGRAPTW